MNGFTPSRAAAYVVLLAAIFLPRLLSLGSIITVDEPLWLSRGHTFIKGFASFQFDKTLVAGQPGVTTAWLVGMVASADSLAAAQASIALTTGLLILLATYFLTKLYGWKWGMTMGFLLALDPFLLAHSRIVHTDGLQALFSLTSILALLTALLLSSDKEKPTRRYVMFSAVLASAAIVSKIFALTLIPTGFLIIALVGWQKKASVRSIGKTLGVWGIVLIIAGYIMWPALWLNADKVFDHLTGRATLHTEGTRSEETTSLAWYYERESWFRLAPTTALLVPFGIWYVARRRNRTSAATLLLLMSGLITAAALHAASDKSDRYILFALLTLIPPAALGIRQLLRLTKKRWPAFKGTPLLLAIPLIYLSADDIRLHPYYLAHYNRLYPIEPTHKLGWGEGLEQAAAWIATKNPQAKVMSYYPRVFAWWHQGEVETITHVNDAPSDYVVLYRSMFERGQDSPEEDILREYLYSGQHTPVHVVTINGLPYAWIFPGRP